MWMDIYAYIHTHTHICLPYTFAPLSFFLSFLESDYPT